MDDLVQAFTAWRHSKASQSQSETSSPIPEGENTPAHRVRPGNDRHVPGVRTKEDPLTARKTDSPQMWLNQQAEAHRNNRDLNDRGVDRRIARAYDQALRTGKAAISAAKAERDAEIQHARRGVFAKHGHTTESRKLRDEALAIKSFDELAKNLRTAIELGDKVAAWAYGTAALDKGMGGMPGSQQWIDLANEWCASDPDVDRAVTKLSDVMNSEPTRQQGWFDNRVMKPAELEKYPNWRALLDDEDHEDRTPAAQNRDEKMAITFKGSSRYSDGYHPSQRDHDRAKHDATYVMGQGLPD